MRIGDERWFAYVSSEGKVEYNRMVLRTIRKPWGYLIDHLHGITWVKKSKKHKDWGYIYPCPPEFRTRFLLDKGPPFSASKRGALRALVAELRADIKEHDDGELGRIWEDDILDLGQQLEKAKRALVRMKP